ncbi:MAG TPA: response regulator [Labilithrix sp.]|jgi:CheY-like chemotaxis protein
MPRVLIADDSPVARVSVARKVRAAGLDVVEEASAAGASAVDGGALACALLDLDLGDGSGADVAARLRASNGALPIAFFTSERGTDAVARASAFGPVFAKPDDLDAAVDWIRRTVGPC